MSAKIDSLKINRNIGIADQALRTSAERLSSGMRINRGADDAAGLQLATSLQTKSRLFSQAVRNINDGVSLLNIADGALQSLQDITQRQQELAEQSANGTFSSTQRQAIQKESNALVDEFNRIVKSTQFNGKSLLNSSDSTAGALQVQAGVTGTDFITLSTGLLSTSTTGDGTFIASGSNATGTQPIAVAVGDINGDGIQDYATADTPNNNISIFIGNGDGTFKSAVSYQTGFDPFGIQLVDVNHDGKLDVVTADRTLNTLSVLLGNGDGTFQTRKSYAVGSAALAGLQLSDVNGDGNLDAVISDLNSDRVDILLGNADGSFKPATSFDTGGGGSPQRLALGDFNGDGKIDIAVAQKAGDAVSILLGNGNGTFQNFTWYNAGGTTTKDVTVGDFNGDGKLDLLTANSGSGTVGVLFGNGNGTFQAAISFAAGAGVSSVSAIDINGDGKLDFATANSTAGTVSIFLNNGSGSFTSTNSYAVGTNPLDVKFADFNGDGALDIVTANNGSNTSSILLAHSQVSSLSSYFDLSTAAASRTALGTAQQQSTAISNARSNVGAGMSRLSTALNNAQTARDSYAAAASRITDVDVASESANYIRAQILLQASVALMAQSGQQYKIVLQLLQ